MKKFYFTWIFVAAFGVIMALCPSCKKGEQKEEVPETLDEDYLSRFDEVEKSFNLAKFAVGKADLNDDAKAALHQLAELMKLNDEVKIRIEGHSSPEGDPGKNQHLSQQRAQAAVDYLINTEGIDASRLRAIGMGSAHIIDHNNLAANRRVEFIVIYRTSFDDYYDEYEAEAMKYAADFEKMMNENEEEYERMMRESEAEYDRMMRESEAEYDRMMRESYY